MILAVVIGVSHGGDSDNTNGDGSHSGRDVAAEQLAEEANDIPLGLATQPTPPEVVQGTPEVVNSVAGLGGGTASTDSRGAADSVGAEARRPTSADSEAMDTQAVDVALSFYVCTGAPAGFQDGYCSTMANGEQVHEGAAACGYAFDLEQRFTIVGDPDRLVYVCADRGLGVDYWIDRFFPTYAEGRAWRSQFGARVTVILE